MKKNTFINLLFLFIVQTFFSQQISPGGISLPHIWLKVSKNAQGYFWQSKGVYDFPIASGIKTGTNFNFNPSINFNGALDQITIPLSVDNAKKQTVFLVYKVSDNSKEQFLWSSSDSNVIESTSTTYRLANLKNFSYKSYDDKILKQDANIHFYQHNKKLTQNSNFQMTIGLDPLTANLPSLPFKGVISEVLIYNRFLSSQETQKVASYLAVKFGISLSQFELKNYLDTNGTVIWKDSENVDYKTSITAIGKDNKSGLFQTKSSNMIEEGFLTIEMKNTQNVFPDNYFVFWSDNGKGLSVNKLDQGGPNGISRNWKLNYNDIGEIKLNWSLDSKFLSGKIPEDQNYWLLIDHSGNGKFEKENIEYVNLGKTVTSNPILNLQNFNWNRDLTSKVNFTIKVAPEMFSHVWIEQPLCGEPNTGKLNYTIQGGQAPYRVIIYKSGTSEIFAQFNQDNSTTQQINVTSGSYDYVVSDVNNKTFKNTVFVSDKNGNFSSLKSEYFLDNEYLNLDASEGLPNDNYSYEWYLDGNLISNQSSISPNKPGIYEIRIINGEGCKTSSLITVLAKKGFQSNQDEYVSIYPNPTINGNFTTAFSFPRKTNVIMTIRNLLGELIKTRELGIIETYYHQENLSLSQGTYLVNIQSEFQTKTFKLIVK